MKKLLVLLGFLAAPALAQTDVVQPVLVVNCPDGGSTNYSGVAQPVTMTNLCGAGSGDITSVTAGLDLGGGGTSGAVTLNLNPGSTQYAQINPASQQTGAINLSSGTIGIGMVSSLSEGTSSYASYNSSGTITPNASLGNNVYALLHSSVTINIPINAVDRQMFRYFIQQDAAGSRSVTLGTGFDVGDLTVTFAATASKEEMIGCIYKAATGKCLVVTTPLGGYL